VARGIELLCGGITFGCHRSYRFNRGKITLNLDRAGAKVSGDAGLRVELLQRAGDGAYAMATGHIFNCKLHDDLSDTRRVP
jgi:hypothetical protein